MARPSRSPSCARPSALAFAVAAALAWSTAPAAPAPAPAPEPAAAASFALADLGLPDIGGAALAAVDDQTLYLEVFFSERPTGQLVRVRLRDGRLFASPEQLRAIGLVVDPVAADVEGLLALDAVPGLDHHYDAAAQRLVLGVPPTLRPQQALGYRRPEPVQATRDSGLLFNYDAYARRLGGSDTLSLGAMLRWFGPAGALDVSGVSRAGDDGESDGYRRLDTRWSFSDSTRLTTWTAGDFISGGLGWTRPVRMGGVQLRRNFGVRPDLITFPIPRFSGQATVPSAVELLVNNVRQFASDVDDGPFVLDAFPRISGAGEATVVVRDALGRATQTTVPIYIDQQRLAPGLSDFSFEAGSLRHGYASDEDRYDSRIVASASYRRGLSDQLTLEAHAEVDAGLRVAGLGGVWAPAGRLGLLTGSVLRSQDRDAGDTRAGQWGSQRTWGYQWMNPRLGFDLQTQRRSAAFRDLGDLGPDGLVGASMRAQDRASAWFSLPLGGLTMSWLRWENGQGDDDRITTLSWSQVLGGKLYANFSMFDSAGSGRGYGLSFNLPLGERRDASLALNRNGGTDVIAGLRQSAPYEGGWGWDLQGGERHGGFGQASANIRGRQGEASFGADRTDGRTGTFAQASGSLVLMAGTAFASRRVGDSFAVVSSNGVAGVPVKYENRLYGHTNTEGFLLLPDLRGWQRNRIAIDPDALGIEYRVPPLEQFAIPADAGGVLVAFDVQRVHPARVMLLGPHGTAVPAGSEGRVAGPDAAAGITFLVGLDGEAYLEDAPAGAVLELTVAGARCRYPLPSALAHEGAGQASIGPLPCEELL